MENKKGSKILAILKYLGKTIISTMLVILIIAGLALLFVFVSTKIAKSKGAEPPLNLYTIISPSMTPNINVYDVVVAVKTDSSKIKVGDVISYYTNDAATDGLTITHRVVSILPLGNDITFKTKGDYNKYEDDWLVYGTDIVGKVYFKIPQLGRIQFFLGSKGGWLLAILIPALAIIAYDIYKIIKLIMIKQKIMAFQKQEDLPKNNPSEITTVDSIVKSEVITPSVETTSSIEKTLNEQKPQLIENIPVVPITVTPSVEPIPSMPVQSIDEAPVVNENQNEVVNIPAEPIEVIPPIESIPTPPVQNVKEISEVSKEQTAIINIPDETNYMEEQDKMLNEWKSKIDK